MPSHHCHGHRHGEGQHACRQDVATAGLAILAELASAPRTAPALRAALAAGGVADPVAITAAIDALRTQGILGETPDEAGEALLVLQDEGARLLGGQKKIVAALIATDSHHGEHHHHHGHGDGHRCCGRGHQHGHAQGHGHAAAPLG